MLIKFTKGGRGSGGQVARYLTNSEREDRNHAPPEVVRGDMDRTRELIDSITRQWTYTHGVLSFALEDAPSEQKQQEAMDAFERLAFAGLDREQWDITWVRHQHTKGGRVELHFVTPRMELTNGKALNIAPPGWASTYGPLRDVLNWENGWARPDDPERAKELRGPPKMLLEGLRGRAGREALHGYLTGLVAAEQVIDRASMVQSLEEAGLKVPRQGRDYLTVFDPESGEKWRMKGRIYEREWTYERELDRAVAKESGKPDGRNREYDFGRIEEARSQLEARVRSRAEFHAVRYPKYNRDAGGQPEEAEEFREMVVGRVDRDLSNHDGIVDLALDAPSAVFREDFHERWRDVSGAACRSGSDDMHEGGLPVPMRALAGEELTHETYDSLRNRFARAIREFGARVRDRARRLGSNVRIVASVCEKNSGEDDENGKGSISYDAIIERTERAARKVAATAECAADSLIKLRSRDPWELEFSLDYPDPKPPWAS